MSRQKRVARNIVILAILSYLFLHVAGLYISPIAAHKRSEQSVHYGPSKIVHTEDFPGSKLILGKYDRWISYTTVYKTSLFFWRYGGVHVFEYERSKPLDYTGGSSGLYGIINEDSIVRVDITLEDGTNLTTTDFYDGLFLFTWEQNAESGRYMELIRAYDAEGNLVFEERR